MTAPRTPTPFRIDLTGDEPVVTEEPRRLPFVNPQGALHLVLDVLMMTGVVVAVTLLLWSGGDLLTSESVRLGVVVGLVVVCALGLRGMYGKGQTRRWPRATAEVMRAVLLGAAVYSFAGFFVAIGGGARRWLLVVVAAWTLCLCLHHGLWALLRAGTGRRVIIAGTAREVLSMRASLRSDRKDRYDVVGFVIDDLNADVPRIVTDMALGCIAELIPIADRYEPDQVMFCLGGLDGSKFAPLARELSNAGVDVALTGLGDVSVKRVGVSHIQGHPVVSIAPASRSGWRMLVKRVVDVTVAGFLLVVLSPLLVLVAVVIRIADGHSPIFTQDRVGKGGENFAIYKFRSMVLGSESTIDLRNDFDGPIFKMDSDPRITRIGRLLRKTSIDELPQLFNVVKGEMSLVGPRPFIPSEIAAAPPSFRDRLLVTPGITGRWQVSGRSDTDFDQLDELDRWYVDNWSLGQDLSILARTVPAVLLQRGAR